MSGTGTFDSTTLTSAGGSDVFVARLTSGGRWRGAISAGGPADDHSRSLCWNSTGRVHVVGRFGSAARFGPTLLQSAGADDGFVAEVTGALSLGVPEYAAAGPALWPNPARGVVYLKQVPALLVEVLDVVGHVVRQVTVPPGQPETRVDLTGLDPGLYIVRTGERTRRLVVE